MTHAELVRTTAENLRLICDRLGYSVKNMDMFTSIARVAVAMKAEGWFTPDILPKTDGFSETYVLTIYAVDEHLFYEAATYDAECGFLNCRSDKVKNVKLWRYDDAAAILNLIKPTN